MNRQRHRSQFESGQHYDQLVTDSMILSETFVDSAIRNGRDDTPIPHRAARGILNGLILSLLFWVLILLPFLII
jgi:hypothetical protein